MTSGCRHQAPAASRINRFASAHEKNHRDICGHVQPIPIGWILQSTNHTRPDRIEPKIKTQLRREHHYLDQIRQKILAIVHPAKPVRHRSAEAANLARPGSHAEIKMFEKALSGNPRNPRCRPPVNSGRASCPSRVAAAAGYWFTNLTRQPVRRDLLAGSRRGTAASVWRGWRAARTSRSRQNVAADGIVYGLFWRFELGDELA